MKYSSCDFAFSEIQQSDQTTQHFKSTALTEVDAYFKTRLNQTLMEGNIQSVLNLFNMN